MTKIAEAAERAEAELHQLYWEECDAVQAAIAPKALGLPSWAEEMLEWAFELAIYCEGHPDGWEEGRARV
jgi:hypothetical protein